MSSLFYYSLNQHRLASDCELPFLPSADTAPEPDFLLRLCTPVTVPRGGMTPWYRNELATPEGCPSIAIDKSDGGDLIVRFADETAFRISADGKSIGLLTAPAEYTRGDVAAYALGPVIAIALHLQGAVLLHAAAVVMKEKAVLFAGDSGSGKSTIAAILHRLGYSVLSDDVTEIVGPAPFRALPSLAAIRLWPDVLDVLYGSADVFPDRAPSWNKKMVTVAEGNATLVPREIGAILFLDAADRGGDSRLERLAPKEGWLRLIADAYTARLPDPTMARRIFEVTSALADGVAMYSLVPPALATSNGLGKFLEHGLEESLR